MARRTVRPRSWVCEDLFPPPRTQSGRLYYMVALAMFFPTTG